jgi:hypothetical protein
MQMNKTDQNHAEGLVLGDNYDERPLVLIVAL